MNGNQKELIKKIILNKLGKEKVNIISDSDNLLEFPFFDKINLIYNSPDEKNFVLTLVFNIFPFDKEINNYPPFLILVDFYNKDNKIENKLYYYIEGNNYTDIKEAIKYYSLVKKINENDINNILEEGNKIYLKIQNILSDISLYLK